MVVSFHLQFSKNASEITIAGWVSVSAFGLARAITGQINNQILVGEELSESMHERER